MGWVLNWYTYRTLEGAISFLRVANIQGQLWVFFNKINFSRLYFNSCVIEMETFFFASSCFSHGAPSFKG
jgi:hypothetical protein